MPKFIRKRLGERLVEEGLITAEQFQTALKKHWDSRIQLRQILIDEGYVTEDQMLEFMGRLLNIPLVRDISVKITNPDIIQLIPEKAAREHVAMPLFREGQTLTVAMADPFDVFAVDDLEAVSKCKIEAVLAKRDEILRTIDTFYEDKDRLEKMVQGMTQEAEELEIVKEAKEEEEPTEYGGTQDVAVDAPIIRLVNTVITQAIKERASDIHVEPDEKNLRIRYRVDGILKESMVTPKRLQAAIISRIKIMAGMDISVKRRPQDGRFKIRIENKDYDMRVSSVPIIYGEKVVMRLLDQSSIQMGLKESGLNEECLQKFREIINRPYGIILVTGPTGSGKTTTLYLALQSINSPDKNIITIEEPVEYDLKGINQIPVNIKAGVNFANGLRSILRQDPDVIMVGEMRDLETADVAVRAALTGHLVFSTLHTNDAPSSVARMVDMGVPPYLVTSAVAAVLAQRLVRKICPNCKEAYQPSSEILADTGLDPSQGPFYKGKGCEQCGQSGYLGRIGVFELMILDKELRKIIHAGKSGDEIRDVAVRQGMQTLWDDGMDKVRNGITTIEELKRVTFTEEE